MEFYKIILSQLGGTSFLAMTGTKVQYYDNEGQYLMMKLTRNKIGAVYLKITLTSMDLYNMEFIKIQRTKKLKYSLPGCRPIWDETPVTALKHENIYDNMLAPLFTEATGLYTSLGTMGR